MVEKGELVYLHRLKEGALQSSFAVHVAQSQGLSQASADSVIQVRQCPYVWIVLHPLFYDLKKARVQDQSDFTPLKDC